MKSRKWTADEKLAIVMEGLKEKRSVAEICREHQIGPPYGIGSRINSCPPKVDPTLSEKVARKIWLKMPRLTILTKQR